MGPLLLWLGSAAVVPTQTDHCASSEGLAWIRSGDHKKLETIMRGQRTDKARHHDYQEMYFRVLQPIAWRKCLGSTEAERTIRILEVGLGCDMPKGAGGSIAVWKEIFIPPLKLELHVMEYDEMCTKRWSERRPGESSGVGIHVGDQNSTMDLDRVYAEAGGKPFDVIIDDGSHLSEHQFTMLMRMIGRVSLGGAYIVEDLHSSCFNYPVNWRRRQVGKHVTSGMAAIGRIGGTADCMRTTRGSPSMYAHLSDWQKDLLMARAPFPELAPSVKHIGLWPAAAAIELSTVGPEAQGWLRLDTRVRTHRQKERGTGRSARSR